MCPSMNCAMPCRATVESPLWVSGSESQAQPEVCGQQQGGPELCEKDDGNYRQLQENEQQSHNLKCLIDFCIFLDSAVAQYFNLFLAQM